MEFSIDLSRILTFFDIFVRKFEKKRSDLKKKGFELQNGVPPFRFWSYFGTQNRPKHRKIATKKITRKTIPPKITFLAQCGISGGENIEF